MNYTLLHADQGYCLSAKGALVSLISGCSGLPYAFRHWELSNEIGMEYRWGHRFIALIQAMPFGIVAVAAERVCVYAYEVLFPPPNESDSVGSYLALAQAIADKRVYVIDEAKQSKKEKIIKLLGTGGSKKAFEISDGRALLLPNLKSDAERMKIHWERMVEEEVAMSDFLTSHNILSPQSKRVYVTSSRKESALKIPAYVSETFSTMKATKGWFIIDSKNFPASTWIENENFLFQNEEDRLKAENWLFALDSMFMDIAKLCVYGIPVEEDSLNLAIVKKSNASMFEVRYFGFDFSSKFSALELPKMEKNREFTLHKTKIERLMTFVLNILFLYEFPESNMRNSSSVQDLKKQLKMISYKKIESLIKTI